MSTLKLNTPDDIVTFLKILAEESVKDARESIKNDPKQDFFVDQLKSDSKMYGEITEQETEAPKEAEVEVEVEEEVEEEPLEASLSSVSDAVKDLRSGHSVDDITMKRELRAYFDRLSGAEQVSLLTFMRAFAGILTMTMTGANAPDPGEPPTSIKMTGSEEAEEAEEAEAVDAEEVAAVGAEEEEEEEEVEDTAPPIQIGKQNVSEIRKRVRALMHS